MLLASMMLVRASDTPLLSAPLHCKEDGLT
jgi:hypothetical protein